MESWIDMPEYADIQISSEGRIRSCRTQGHSHTKLAYWKYLTPHLNKTLYTIGLRKRGIRSKQVFAIHRLVWTLFKGPIPDGLEIDHINRNITDNSINNLRLATKSQNQCNRRNRNKTYKGVSVVKPSGKYRAIIYLNRKKTHIGNYATFEEASAAYNEAAKKLHGEFALLNESSTKIEEVN